MTTRLVARVIIQRVETSSGVSGFNGSGPSKESVYTDLDVVVTEPTLSGLLTKITYSLALVHPTVKASDVPVDEDTVSGGVI